MPRQSRLDAPGVLHHVRFRGIERRSIFIDDSDRMDLLARLEKSCAEGRGVVYAWCLMPNHVHLAIRTGIRPLKKTMSSLLTGYAQSFNRRHKRCGHLMQNRYKSTVVEDDRYFLGLVRYIHLNPVKAKIVAGLEQLEHYPWTGHSALMGNTNFSFQDTDEVLARFGQRGGAAREELHKFMAGADAKRDEKIFAGAGGGLVRSIGGVSELSEYRKGPKQAYDERILGCGAFVTKVLEQAGAEEIEVFPNKEKRREAYHALAKRVCELSEIDLEELHSGSRRRDVARVRQVVAYIATRKLGVPSQDVANMMNVTAPAITAAANKGLDQMNARGWEIEVLLKRESE